MRTAVRAHARVMIIAPTRLWHTLVFALAAVGDPPVKHVSSSSLINFFLMSPITAQLKIHKQIEPCRLIKNQLLGIIYIIMLKYYT